jgi:hypothetical protein
MEAAGFSETLLPTYQTVRCHIPDDFNLHIYRQDNRKCLKSVSRATVRAPMGGGHSFS